MSLRKKIITLLLIIIFLAFYGGNTMFYHIHYINNVAYVHSHPFSSSNHAHSNSVLQSIDHINGGLSFIGSAFDIALSKLEIVSVIISKDIEKPFGITYQNSSLRAPPSMIL